ncbi:MAG: chromosome segregation protein SMC, partial [Methylobacteriaceae bacterium]|nr:chromosome segregation protein SMC [Methylobacteriaceae bacterium]
MKLHKLRIVGFKSFVDPTDFIVEPGLTGVVGPNGCGKSNLVEALRWVMGETSHKNMRASGMDDVIFAGSANRPARNTAEVVLVLDNAERDAPPGFNEADSIEVTRRIEREAGSTYRINGREVRARDVQVLFADVATGARSAAMVRQGQISEIIAARPQSRRRILEEAAGIAGLHSRRHEADLRLKAADDNLLRVEDVLKQVGAQLDSLKRQGRQAARYRTLSTDIRRAEALLLLIGYRDSDAQLAAAQRKLDLDTREVAERTLKQAASAQAAAVAAEALPPLRENEARAGAALQRLVLARDALDAEENRAKEQAAEFDHRVTQLRETLAREAALIEDADTMLARLAGEDEALAAESAFAATVEEAARLRLEEAETALAGSEKALQEAQSSLADVRARREALDRTIAEETQRIARLDAEHDRVGRERAAIADGGEADGEAALTAGLEQALAATKEAEARA